tara:strand:+ start:1000 stop:1293 length:294 start_codon:yes stop_codon:yes gene_type:complete
MKMTTAIIDSKTTDTGINSLATLQDDVKSIMASYFQDMKENGLSDPENLYEAVMTEVELPLIEATMDYTSRNQSKATIILGINRGTFRKKLAHYGMI